MTKKQAAYDCVFKRLTGRDGSRPMTCTQFNPASLEQWCSECCRFFEQCPFCHGDIAHEPLTCATCEGEGYTDESDECPDCESGELSECPKCGLDGYLPRSKPKDPGFLTILDGDQPPPGFTGELQVMSVSKDSSRSVQTQQDEETFQQEIPLPKKPEFKAPLLFTGAELRKRRERLGWSQQRLARALSISKAEVQSWETRATEPIDQPTVVRIFKFTGWTD